MKDRFKVAQNWTPESWKAHEARHLPRYNDAQALADIYRRLDELEPVESDQEVIRPIDELFHWPLGAAFLLVLGAMAAAMLPGVQRVVAVHDVGRTINPQGLQAQIEGAVLMSLAAAMMEKALGRRLSP